MRIAGLHLKNWMIFAGENHLALDAKAYALVAQFDRDEGRSNGAGKSALVDSIGYALFGRHRFRTEDEVICRGEKAAEVRIEFDDGSVATRGRKVGKSTILAYVVDGRELRGPEAQAEIIRRVGLDEQDFYVTCSLEQRQAARFILAKPEERLTLVSGWFGLEALENAETEARGRASTMLEEQSKIANAIEARRLAERESLGYDEATEVIPTLDAVKQNMTDGEDDPFVARSLSQLRRNLRGEIDRLEGEVAAARATFAERKEARSAAVSIARKFEDARRLATLTVEGKALVKKVSSLDSQIAGVDADGVVAAAKRAVGDHEVIAQEVSKRRIVARGEFDGRCPVAELSCPARQQINDGREAAKVAYDDALARSRVAFDVAARCGEEAENLHGLQLAHREAATKLESARKIAKSLQASAKDVEGRDEPDVRALEVAESSAHDKLVELERELATCQQRIRSADKARKERLELVEQQEAVERRLATARESTRIFGKEGAQRMLAESALGQVEILANKMLVTAGADLSVAVRWSREGKGLATACRQCGWPFPASARVKECSRCREARGQKVINALELILSWRSGAAEDLAGIAVQLAASSWLRSARRSAWETAILDEPAAQLDATHRRGFIAGVSRMLSAAAFTQSFLIAHHAAIVDALPGRILVTSDGTRSRVEVMA